MRTITIHNTSGSAKNYEGQNISAGETYTLSETDLLDFKRSPELFTDIASGNVLIGNSNGDIIDAISGWAYFIGDEITIKDLPLSDLEGAPLAVHPSYKPHVSGGTTYAVWTGAGDDVDSTPNVIGAGDLMHFNMKIGTAIKTRDIKFSPDFGRIWIHEAYLKFTNGGEGDFIEADVMAEAAVVQTAANLDLELDGDTVKPAAGGPGSGTHGWAATPALIPRTYSKDGDWDYDGTNLIPNLGGTGLYCIKTIVTEVHRYVNKIPTFGNCPYFSMSSDETAELLPGYYLRVNCHNVSNTNWHISIIMEIYREQTVN